MTFVLADAEADLAIADDDATRALAIVGGPGTGKTRATLARALRIAQEIGEGRRVLLVSPVTASLERLRRAADGERALLAASFGDLALDALARRPGAPPQPIDAGEAARRFAALAAPLLAADFDVFFAGVELPADLEVSGLGTPERFLATALRLMRRLQAAAIGPAEFRARCRDGARAFYGSPPNLADTALLGATDERHRGALHCTREELARQHDREVDLARVIARLYELYESEVIGRGALAPHDRAFEAARVLAADAALAGRMRADFPHALIDDAQEMSAVERTLLTAIYGRDLAGVTLAGDARQTLGAFSGALREAAFSGARSIELRTQHRAPPEFARAAQRALGDLSAPKTPAIERRRYDDPAEEARALADGVAGAIAAGTPASAVAVVVQNVTTAGRYLDALLAREVDAEISGDGSLFAFAPALDALAALWMLADPYRNDWLLRALASPWIALADATVARLCSERPDDPTFPALDLPEPPPSRKRWDPRRAYRLARAVFAGSRDAELPEESRARLRRVRAAFDRWEGYERRYDAATLARLIVAETVRPGAPLSARERFASAIVERCLERFDAFVRSHPNASLHDLLIDAERGDDGTHIEPLRDDAVRVVDVASLAGSEFDRVFVPDLRAGAFPPYYAAEAFLFSPALGIVARDNFGERCAGRTAKFVYMQHRTRAREKYIESQRRALYVAITRARAGVHLSASGRPTRGKAAPELLEIW